MRGDGSKRKEETIAVKKKKISGNRATWGEGGADGGDIEVKTRSRGMSERENRVGGGEGRRSEEPVNRKSKE